MLLHRNEPTHRTGKKRNGINSTSWQWSSPSDATAKSQLISHFLISHDRFHLIPFPTSREMLDEHERPLCQNRSYTLRRVSWANVPWMNAKTHRYADPGDPNTGRDGQSKLMWLFLPSSPTLVGTQSTFSFAAEEKSQSLQLSESKLFWRPRVFKEAVGNRSAMQCNIRRATRNK
jgi:hypothetical protein